MDDLPWGDFISAVDDIAGDSSYCDWVLDVFSSLAKVRAWNGHHCPALYGTGYRVQLKHKWTKSMECRSCLRSAWHENVSNRHVMIHDEGLLTVWLNTKWEGKNHRDYIIPHLSSLISCYHASVDKEEDIKWQNNTDKELKKTYSVFKVFQCEWFWIQQKGSRMRRSWCWCKIKTKKSTN